MGNSKKYINNRERIAGMVYVSLLFVAAMGTCAYFILSQNGIESLIAQKSHTMIRRNRVAEFRDVQREYGKICDSLEMRIEGFNPALRASYEENDINYMIGELISGYYNNRHDIRYRAFYQMGNLYESWLKDKKSLWAKKENVAGFTKNVEDCETSLTQKNETLKSLTKN